MKPLLFAAYLPQYHETEENNRFWGKGFTDWVTVKAAVPLYQGHNQPKIPLNNNYYDLSDYQVIKSQAELAKKYKIDGFNIYHYYFEKGKRALYKPAELLLSHPEIEIKYFFTWDNSSWKRTWSNVVGNDWVVQDNARKVPNESPYLMKLDYGDETDWKEHFCYLLPFFNDSRYLKIGNCPVMMLFNNIEVQKLKPMIALWNNLAVDAGYSGMYISTQKGPFIAHREFDSEFYYQPHHAGWAKQNAINCRLSKLFNYTPKVSEIQTYDYNRIYRKVLKEAKHASKKDIIGAFVSYDDTPRRGVKGRSLKGATPELFKKYFGQIYDIALQKNNNIILLTAWNEWGEGAYLEPDTESGYAYLEAVKQIVEYADKQKE